MKMLLGPLVLVVVLLGLLPFTTLILSGVRETMESNAVNLDSRAVENRGVQLGGSMVDQWSVVRKESDYLNRELEDLLSEQGISAADFLGDSVRQRAYAEQVFPELLEYLRRDNSCGVYLVLANDGDVNEAGEYTGFFLRDSDPTTLTDTDSDLLVERGDKVIARSTGITLDNSWSPTFNFAGAGARSCDDFFYTPYLAALEHKNVDMANLGYWSEPFVLEDNTMDNHRMIAYSVPLMVDGEVYAILGTEVSTSFLANNYLNVQDLDRDQNAGYVLAIKQEDGSYEAMLGVGSLYDAACRSGSFSLSDTGQRSLSRVDDVLVGSQGVYALSADLDLYSSRVPYANSHWVLLGLVPEKAIFGLGNQVYRTILAVIVACALVGLAILLLTVRAITRPVYALMNSVRGGIEGLRSFEPSNIAELDELHEVIQALTEGEIETEGQLSEEKERYRLALESSRDAFFTFAQDDGTLEVVNSRSHNGIWQLERWRSELIEKCLGPEDAARVVEFLDSDGPTFHEQMLFTFPENPDGRWYEVSGTAVAGTAGEHRRVVGYVRDIDEAKRRELKQMRDPVTSLLRLMPGMERVAASLERGHTGVLTVIDVRRFGRIVQDYGITFGDVLLDELSRALIAQFRDCAEAPGVLIRAGADEFIVWSPRMGEDDVRARFAAVAEKFSGLVRGSVLTLDLYAGMTRVGEAAPAGHSVKPEALLHKACVALAEARRGSGEIVAWEDVRGSEARPKAFGEIVSTGYAGQVGLASLALNLLDRRFSLAAAMDLLSLRLRERFNLKNLVITSFNEDYQSVSVRYVWKPIDGIDPQSYVRRLTHNQCEALGVFAARNSLQPLGALLQGAPLFPGFDAPGGGVAFAMLDDGEYSGTIYLVGIDEGIFGREEKLNLLWEVCTIIQNRLNQEHLDQSARAKSDFLARMSHEIRTPMNGIIGMTEIALKEGQTDERRVDCLRKVNSSSHYLLGLINDILDMSKIESGKMHMVSEKFDLCRTIDDLHPVLDAKFREKGQRFVIERRLEHSCFVGDQLRISQVLINLLGNAAKYSGEGTEVVLSVIESPAQRSAAGDLAVVSFSVRDHGIGVSEEDKRRIFDKFEQVDSSMSRQQGTGLGLAISNRIVQMMGSSISLESEVGCGSTFSFTLSLPVAEGVAANPAPEGGKADLGGIRVLAVEDNPLNMEILALMLQDLGCEVEEAGDGAAAVEKFSSSPNGYYDAIVMDVMMPVMDGLEATRRIRGLARQDAVTVPIIAASANAFDEDIKRSLAAGMDAHISKPISTDKLRETLASLV